MYLVLFVLSCFAALAVDRGQNLRAGQGYDSCGGVLRC